MRRPKREFELGCDDKNLADGWIADLSQWIGLPKVESLAQIAPRGCARGCKVPWLLGRVTCWLAGTAFICAQVERLERAARVGEEKVARSQWMEARVVVYTPDEISDEELGVFALARCLLSHFAATK